MRAGLVVVLIISTCASVLAAPSDVPGMTSPGGARPMTPDREWAVLVGVSKYASLPQSEWLNGADTDATALAAFLQSPRGGAFPADHVKLLVNGNATTTGIRLAMDFLIKHVRTGDVAWIFFAGHGTVELYGGGETAYLLPYDSDVDHLNATALPMDELRRYVDVSLRQASQVVLITDACHAGGLHAPTLEADDRVATPISDYLLSLGDRAGVLNIMACRRDENAIEDPRLGGHGVLTYCLLKALNGDGNASPDGVVRTEDVLEYVMREVPRLTDQRQHPRNSVNYDDEFPMSHLREKGAALDLPPLPGGVLNAVERESLPTLTAVGSTLRVVGSPVNSELYLVHGTEQRTIGRVLSQANVLLLDGIPPGKYLLVQTIGGKQTQWQIDLSTGLHTFDVRKGEID